MNYLNMCESTTQIYAVERNWTQKDNIQYDYVYVKFYKIQI